MPEMKPREQLKHEDLEKAASLSLEDLTKWMAEWGLFGFSITDDSYDKKLKELERVARLSSDARIATE
ncbi:MAG: hypothetical protein ACE5OZ_02075 [Candidatus Heimdallarchaeota archaeon]